MSSRSNNLPPGAAMRTNQARIDACTRCGNCVPVCPSFRATGDEALSARGRISLMEAVLEGSLGLTSGLSERLSLCLECGACTEVCPGGLDIPSLILAMRAELTGAGKNRLAIIAARGLLSGKPADRHRRLLDFGGSVYRRLPAMPIPRTKNSRRRAMLPPARSRNLPEQARRRNLPEPARRRLDSLIPEISRPGSASMRLVFFPGCATSLYYQETAQAAVRVLNRAGAEVVLPRDSGCCGLPFRTLGDASAADRQQRDCLQALCGQQADAIVTVCSSCALELRQGAASIADAPRVLDIHELLAEIGVPEPSRRRAPRPQESPGTIPATWGGAWV